MKQPCELITWYVVPSIRAELARSLNDIGLNQREIAEEFGITQGAVSLYFRQLRGANIDFNDEIKEMIYQLAVEIYMGKCDKKQQVERICEICQKTKEAVEINEFMFMNK